MPAKSSPSDRHAQDAYLFDMLESAQHVRQYMANVTFEEFWDDSEKRDAVALRLSVIGEASRHVTDKTAAALPEIPFTQIRGMRNRISHDYRQVNFRTVWQVTQEDITPLVSALTNYFRTHKPPQKSPAKP